MINKSPSHTLILHTLAGVLLLITGSCISGTPGNYSIASTTLSPLPSTAFLTTSTVTVQPTMLNISPTSTSVPTWTPLPTLAPSELDSFIESMTAACDLPCWGDLTPGQTSMLETKHFIESFGTIIGATSLYFDYHNKAAVIDFTFKNDVVSSINLPPELTDSYELHHLLARFGLPEDVRIEVIPETADGTPWFYVAVFYPQQGILAIYSGQGQTKDSVASLCFTTIYPDLFLVASNSYSLEQMNNILDPTLRRILEPIAELTGMTVNEFYNTFNHSLDTCLATVVQVP